MIVELTIGAGLVTAGMLLARAMRRRQEDEHMLPGADPRPDRDREENEAKESGELTVGAVLLYGTEELWLAGAIELEDEALVCRLYRTPGARTGWVAQLDAEGQELARMKHTNAVPAGRVPDELPVGGLRLSLRRRGRARVHAEGEHLPPVREQADYTILEATGGRTLVVVDFVGGSRLALVGEHLGREMLDVLPGS